MQKLLIDNNLSVFLKEILEDYFPGTKHVADINMTQAGDTAIWEIARKEFHAIISKDRDFYFRVTLYGAPPKVIWITRGNCRNRELLNLIRNNLDEIKSFLNSDRDVMTIQ